MENPMFKGLKDVTDLIDNINAPARKIRKIVEGNNLISEFVKWQQALLPIINFSTVEIPGICDTTPLALYYAEMQTIVTRIASVQATTDNINQLCREFENEKTEAENNYYHRLYVEEKEQEIATQKRDLAEANRREAESAKRIHELEIALRVMSSLAPPTPKPHKKAVLSLKPCITPSQIVRLYEATKWLFTSTLDQWRNLFSEDIQAFETPIAVTSKYKSDVRILFHYLLEEHLIDNLNYPSILEKIKVFSYEGKIITARQLHKPTEYDNYPEIGNYINIKQIASDL